MEGHVKDYIQKKFKDLITGEFYFAASVNNEYLYENLALVFSEHPINFSLQKILK